jgi:hypothetical protein
MFVPVLILIIYVLIKKQMTAVKRQKKQSKKESEEIQKMIPESLLCSFIFIFLKTKAININGYIIVSYEPLNKKLIDCNYNSWLVNSIPDGVFKVRTDQQKNPTYRHYLEKFIKDFFEIEIIKLKENEYYIDSTPEKEYYEVVKKGLKSIGFVTK